MIQSEQSLKGTNTTLISTLSLPSCLCKKKKKQNRQAQEHFELYHFAIDISHEICITFYLTYHSLQSENLKRDRLTLTSLECFCCSCVAVSSYSSLTFSISAFSLWSNKQSQYCQVFEIIFCSTLHFPHARHLAKWLYPNFKFHNKVLLKTIKK